MKLLFIHDHPFYIERGLVYSGGGLPKQVWSNYLNFFSNVSVFGRRSFDSKDKKTLSSCEGVTFCLTLNYTSIVGLLKNQFALRREITAEICKVDAVLVRLPSILGFFGAYCAFQLGKTIIVEQVGSAEESMNTHGSLLGKISAPFLQKINKTIVKNANYVSYVTISKLQREYPTRAFNTSISNVIINHVKRSSEVDLCKFEANPVRIGLIGGFDVRYKGQDVLLKAIANLEDSERNNIELFFVGKGNSSWIWETAKKLKVQKNIKYIGPKEAGDEIFEFLATLHIYVQPSLTEGMPRALLEAMSVGCPALGSTVGGIPDVIEAVHLHKPGDYVKLSMQIDNLLKDRNMLRNEVTRSLEVVKPFQKGALDQKRKEFYNVIIKNIKK